MRPLKELIPLDEALRMVMDVARPVERRERVDLADALRRVAAEDVLSPRDVPLADRAAMDGYALRAEDTLAGSPAVLRRIETLYAGSIPKRVVSSGTCAEIATGATLPRGADAVVMVEDTVSDGDEVRVRRVVRAGEHVYRRGDDLHKGSPVVREGEVLTPAKLGALAAIGRDRTAVFARPRVAILTSGDEVIPPGRPIRAGQVYDVNSQTLAAVVSENGGEPVRLGPVRDRLDALRAALRRARKADLVVLSGGSSVGEKDLIVDVLRSEGEVLFHGISVRPGKPTVLGRVGRVPVLGMPGNPTSCLNNAYVILAPMLRRMARRPPPIERIVEVPLAERVVSVRGRTDFVTVRLVDGRAVPASKGSGAITSMAHADGYLEIPADLEAREAGERVRVVLF